MPSPPDPGETAHGRAAPWRERLATPGPLTGRLERRASLTIGLLGDATSGWIERYEAAEAGTTSVAAFLDHVIANCDTPVIRAIAQFERALVSARAARQPTVVDDRLPRGAKVRLHPAACVVDLPGPADQVISAIALGLGVPAYAGWPVLVAPGLPTLWRQATPLEDALCTWLTRPRSTMEVLERFPGAERTMQRLVSARALIDIT